MKKKLLTGFRAVIGTWVKASTICLVALLAMSAHLTVSAAMQQQASEIQVTGMVTDQQKEPLVGVTVAVVGGQARTISDLDGMFRITVPQKSTTELELTYIGFKRKIVKVNGARLLNVLVLSRPSSLLSCSSVLRVHCQITWLVN